VCNASPLGEIMTHTEIQEIHRKLDLPTIRDESGKIIPTEFSEKELSFIIFEMMHEMREENRRKSGSAIEKNWNKMSKQERKELEK
tara:strand:- start:271 stop:528 length:258 start_codon:yes stop_codon:yes gene_type:complete